MSKINVKKHLNKNKIKSNKKKPKFDKKRVKFNLNDKQSKTEDLVSDSGEDVESDEELGDGSDGSLDAIVDHKKTLNKLKETDKEFYDFLQQNDKQLLDFDVSDDESDDEDNDVNQESDETELSDKISLKQIDKWGEQLKDKLDIGTIKSIIKWFRRAVNQTSGESEGRLISTDAFNALFNICLIDLLPAIHKFLKLPQIGSNEWSNDIRAIDPTKSRNWKKLMSVMKIYLTDVIKMVGVVSEPSLKSSLLRHILHLIPFIITFPHLIKRVLKQTIILWSESDEKNRILSFICILRLIRTQEQPMISFILKKLYISYVKNCKFTKESNISLIQFMRHSLAELYSLDSTVAYQHSFVFIRQLAINLRTAMTVKKKESYKCVYNWQFLHSILLWTHLLCSQSTVDELKPLICPLVNVIMGTIRLIPSSKFFPMRFHLIKALIRLSDETNTFIPILPLITEIFDHFDKIKKNKVNDEKELNFELLIKISKLNSNDFEFRDLVVNKAYDLILYYLSTQSNRIAFPELVQISIIKMKKFLKRSHVVQHNQLLKQLLEKIEENCKFISEKRKIVDFSITDSLSINSWESQLKCDGTPITLFYNQRKKIRSERDMTDTVLESVSKSGPNLSTEPPGDEAEVDQPKEKKNAMKRKLNETPNKAKRVKMSKKSKKRLTKRDRKPKTESFELNQTLDISSDESD